MGTDFRWLKTTVRANPKQGEPDWDCKDLGYSKRLQTRQTGLFGSDWEDVWTTHENVYVDEIQPVKVEGLVEDYKVTKKVN